ENSQQIPILIIFIVIMFFSILSIVYKLKIIENGLGDFLLSKESRYGLGVIFLSLLVFTQNQLANGFLITKNNETYYELLDYQDKIELKNLELKETKDNLVDIIAESLEYRLSETSNHVKRVSLFTQIILDKLEYDCDDREEIISSATLHDIGKIGIPDHILRSKEKFTDAERKIMERHTIIGYDILRQSTTAYLQLAATIAYEHHENWDGSGYPLGKSGLDINFASRVVSIADTFDALVNQRSYKKAWTVEQAYDYLISNSGIKYDPYIISAMQDAVKDFKRILEEYKPIERGSEHLIIN
ncbi:MAG: HD domain-containing protein, partial [Spirochaetales bacterium]|nr:HD domain-containing protein [Spirochaetales bacterium]